MKNRALCTLLSIFIGAAALAGCGGSQGGVAPGPIGSNLDRSRSWMTPDKKTQAGALLYVGDSEADVDVFSGFPKRPKLVGTLTGFTDPTGMCVDKKGDVFIATETGTVDEYAHGGTTERGSYTTDGLATGCSISARGDVAVTDAYSDSGSVAGQVCVWKSGKGSSTCYRDPNVCLVMFTFGYDDKGDLIGEGTGDGAGICELPAGASQMIALSLSNFKIGYPAGTQWDGKYIALGDQDVASQGQSGVWEVKLSGSTLTAVGSEIVFSDNCDSDYTDVSNPFFTATTNVTPASTKRATGMVAPNAYCTSVGKPAVDAWAYPKGGMPTTRLTKSLDEPSGVAISIAN